MAGITAESVLVIKVLMLSAESTIFTPFGYLSAIKFDETVASNFARLINSEELNPFVP